MQETVYPYSPSVLYQPVEGRHRVRRNGFTLVELSIVLVIIGLLAGGVLVGKDLIKAAEIRSVIKEVDEYNSAVTTFRLKYNGLAGDMTYSDASAFFALPAECSTYSGNNDGGIQAQESKCFWFAMGESGLVKFKPTYPYQTGYSIWITNFNDLAGVTVPKSTYSEKSGWKAATFGVWGTDKAPNRFFLATQGGGIMSSGYIHSGGAVTPQDAYSIDAKIDDGMPNATYNGHWANNGAITSGIANKKVISTYGFEIDTNTPQACSTNSSTYKTNNTQTACVISFLMN